MSHATLIRDDKLSGSDVVLMFSTLIASLLLSSVRDTPAVIPVLVTTTSCILIAVMMCAFYAVVMGIPHAIRTRTNPFGDTPQMLILVMSVLGSIAAHHSLIWWNGELTIVIPLGFALLFCVSMIILLTIDLHAERKKADGSENSSRVLAFHLADNVVLIIGTMIVVSIVLLLSLYIWP